MDWTVGEASLFPARCWWSQVHVQIFSQPIGLLVQISLSVILCNIPSFHHLYQSLVISCDLKYSIPIPINTF